MDQTEWLVFTCRACRGLIKISPGMAGLHVVCPNCRTKVSVPKDAIKVKEDHNPHHIPSARTADPHVSTMRGPGREEWEMGSRPIGGDIEFRERLTATSAPEMKPDPENPSMVRVNMRRRKHEQTHSDFDDPAHSRRRRSRQSIRTHGQAFAKTMVRGLTIAVVIFAGIAGWLGWQQWKLKPGQPKSPYIQVAPPDAGPDGPKLETRSMAEYGPALRDAVKGFVQAPTVDAMLPLIRDRERLEPKIRAFYTPENPWEPLEIRNKLDPSDVFTVDGNFIHLQLSLVNFAEIPIAFERKGESFLADWESFTGYGEMSWAELMKMRPNHPVLMRVVIEKSMKTEYYNEDFTDPAKFACYQLRDRNSQYFLSGYAPPGSLVDTKIRQHLHRLPAPAATTMQTLAVIRVRYPAHSTNSRQVEITEFLENGWVFRPDNDGPSPPEGK